MGAALDKLLALAGAGAGASHPVPGYTHMGRSAAQQHLIQHHGMTPDAFGRDFAHPHNLDDWHHLDHVARPVAGHAHSDAASPVRRSLSTAASTGSKAASSAEHGGGGSGGHHGGALEHLPGAGTLVHSVHQEIRRTADRETRRRLQRAVYHHAAGGAKPPPAPPPPPPAPAASGGASGGSSGSGSGSSSSSSSSSSRRQNQTGQLSAGLDGVLELTPETAEASTVPKPIHPGGPGLWKHKHWMAPPYVEHVAQALMRKGKSESDAYHMAVGLMHSWAAGHDGKGHKVHGDVRAAASANLAKWEELRAHAHASHALKRVTGKRKDDSGDTATTATEGGIALAVVATAPGAKPLEQYGLNQHPPQTTAGPALPPKQPLPKASDVAGLEGQVPPGGDVLLANSVRTHIRTAAMKLSRNDPQGALHSLRAVQAAILAAHKADNAAEGSAPYVANVFARVPSAEQSSATTAMRLGTQRVLAWRGLETKVAGHIDTIRRHYFHGMYGNGQADHNLGFAREDNVSALDRVLLAVPSAHDVSEPVATGSSMETPYLQARDSGAFITGPKATQELADMNALDRLQITAHLDAARKRRDAGNYGSAATCLLKAKDVAHTAGALHVCEELHSHVRALADQGSTTPAPDSLAKFTGR